MNPDWLAGLGLLSLLLFVGSLVMVPWILARIPDDWFATRVPRRSRFRERRPVAAWVVDAARNVLGAILFGAGLAMLVLPGQGLLTMAAGVFVARFPGKRRLELWLLARPGVLPAINWVRARRGRPPLRVWTPD